MKSKTTRIFLTLLLSLSLMLPGSTVFAAQSGTSQEMKFDKNKKATTQLKNLFTTMDIMDATIEGLTKEMEEGNVTSEQITQMYIDRINAYDNKKNLNSIISINPNALKEARKLDKERKAGKIRGSLHGIPILVKDNIDVAGMATTGGSVALAHMVVKKDATVVKRLRDAGAIIIAKANLSEFASSAVDSESLLGGVVHNAYDTTRTPAGSSGGTGVAVTSNFATVGLGTDTGGSIRNPSSWSNLYGIRPSKGLTSIEGIIPLNANRDTVGPMARTAEDMAKVLEVMAGSDKKDDFTLEANADKLVGSGYTKALSEKGLKGKRIGYLTSSFEFIREYEDQKVSYNQIPAGRIDAMVKRTRANLTKAGAKFVDLSNELKDDELLEMTNANSDQTTEYDFNKYLNSEGDAAPYKTLKALYNSGKVGIEYMNLPVSPEKVPDMADSFQTTKNPYTQKVNGYMRGETWKQALDYRAKVIKVMKEKKVDAIMYITTLDVPPTYADLKGNNLKLNYMSWYAYGFNFGPVMGMPEVIIPMGFSDKDSKVRKTMPLGLHLCGKFGDEKTLMQMSYAYEKQAGSSIRRIPPTSPALKDKNLEAFLEELMDQAYSIDYAAYNKKPTGKVKLMQSAWAKAAAVDTSDPYATYKAASRLARSYDKVIRALKKSGVKKQQKQETSFDLHLTKSKLKAKKKKKQTVWVLVSNLTRGSARPVFSVRRVTNGQKARVKVNKYTGKVIIKKKTKKCKVVIQVTSKANSRCKSLTKSVTIRVA